MKVITSWLRQFSNPDVSDEKLAETLTMTGLEVDSINTIAPSFTNVVVGEVIKCEKHPNADKLNLCQVNIGNETLQIICGAKNIRSGIKVCVATNGAILPGNFKIKKAVLRGIESNGMICSESEIGLVEKSAGIMELDNSASIGTDVRKYLNLDDKIIELDITPNRGDCFSILGVAREVCANYDTELNYQVNTIKANNNSVITTNVESTKHCPKYLTRVIKDIDNSIQTPKWMQDILLRSSYSLNSAIVDITNFVLLELGQPLHAFDKEKIDGNISVRLAKNNESIALLNEQKIKLVDDTLVIADNSKILAIAGIMGGISSSTTIDTKNIVLESAFFDNILIAGKARNYGLHTESSLRFERGVDFNLAEIAIERTTELILEICGGNASNVSSNISTKDLKTLKKINIKFKKINQVLGFSLDKNWVKQKFDTLNFIINHQNEESITITPPSYRFDINIEADLIEELARLYGYDKLPTSNLDHLSTNLKINNSINKYDQKNILVNRNYNEVITYSFISEEMSDIVGGQKIKLINPISADMQFMRSSIIAGLLKTAVDNNNRGQKNLRIFETGLCFNGENADEQIEKIAGLISGKSVNNWIDKDRDSDFFDLKSDVLSLIGNRDCHFISCEHKLLQNGQAAKIIIDDNEVGIIGCLSPKVQKKLSLNKCFIFELNLMQILASTNIKYQDFSNYQSASRDISLLLSKEISYQEIISVVEELKQQNLISIKLIDVWNGDEFGDTRQSLTFSLEYQASDKTLIDTEVDNSVKEVLNLLISKYKAEQR